MILKNRFAPIQVLLIIIFILLTLDWMSTASNFHPLFDVNTEMNLPTWFSTILLFSIALFAFVLQIILRSSSRNFFAYFWTIFSGMYLYFSLDEMVRVHEVTIFVFHRWKSFHWYYLYMPFVFALFVYSFLYFTVASSSDKNIRNWVLLGMLVSALGGIGFEMIADLFIEDAPKHILRLFILAEEGMEMAGAAMILQGFWLMLANSISFVKE